MQLGPRQDEYYPVLKGLAAGDRIAAAGGFLVDAETRLNPAAAATFFGASGGPRPAAPRRRRSRPEQPHGHGGQTAHDDRCLRDDIKNIEQLPDEIGSRPRQAFAR